MLFFTIGNRMKKMETNTIKKSTQKTIETGTRPVLDGDFLAVLRGAVFR